MEDLDPPREVPGAAQAILNSLAAFGMVSDEPVWYQSTRTQAYQAALERLAQQGDAFPCACSRKDLSADGVYPGTCRDGMATGRHARSWRLKVAAGDIGFVDAIQGQFAQDLRSTVGDFVIRRADGLTAYHLAVVVDDAAQGITEVVRGADLLDSTPRQILLQGLLNRSTPAYAHLPLAVDDQGNKLSKRTRALPVDDADPLPALRAALAFLGQRLPLALHRASLPQLWRYAQESWRLDAVPRRHVAAASPVGAASPPRNKPDQC